MIGTRAIGVVGTNRQRAAAYREHGYCPSPTRGETSPSRERRHRSHQRKEQPGQPPRLQHHCNHQPYTGQLHRGTDRSDDVVSAVAQPAEPVHRRGEAGQHCDQQHQSDVPARVFDLDQ